MEIENMKDMNHLIYFTETLRELKNFNTAELSPLEKVANNILSYLLRVTMAQEGLVAVIIKEKTVIAASTSNVLSISEEEIGRLWNASEPVIDNRNIMLIPLK